MVKIHAETRVVSLLRLHTLTFGARRVRVLSQQCSADVDFLYRRLGLLETVLADSLIHEGVAVVKLHFSGLAKMVKSS